MNSGLKFVFAFFALSMLVMAQGGELKELKNNVLVAKYDQVACRASFYDGILQDAKDLGLGSRYNISVDALREKIGTDLVALKSAAENGDRKGFLFTTSRRWQNVFAKMRFMLARHKLIM